MTRVEIDPGICGMSATIEVDTTERFTVAIKITGECKKVSAMGNSLSHLTIGDALKPHVDSVVYKYAAEHHLCASCAIPVGILKAVEVEVGLALPRPVVITFQNKA